MATDPRGRRPRHHAAVNEVLSTLAAANSTLADVQRRLDADFRAAYPDHVSKLAPPPCWILPHPPARRG